MKEQNTILSVFLNTDRVYIAVAQQLEKGMQLLYANSTDYAIDLDLYEEGSSYPEIGDLQNLLLNLPFKFTQLTVSLPAESLFVTQFPGRPGITDSELITLVNIELRQNFPQLDSKDFMCTLLPLGNKLIGNNNVISIIAQKSTANICKQILEPLGLPIHRLEVSQLNALNSFLYNYPELNDKCTVLFGIQNGFIDISVVSNKSVLYFQLRTYSKERMIPDICKEEIEKLFEEYTLSIDSVFLYGVSLNSEILYHVNLAISDMITEVKRLSAFRMFKTDFDYRDREYCSRTAHIFPSCIGAIIPSYLSKLKLY